MAADTQRPLLDITTINSGVRHSCSNGNIDDSSSTPPVDVTLAQASKPQLGRASRCKVTSCGCNSGKHRTNSEDSGLSLNSHLNPIAEHGCSCCGGYNDIDETRCVVQRNDSFNARGAAVVRYEIPRNNSSGPCSRWDTHGSFQNSLQFGIGERRCIQNGNIGRNFERIRSKSESCRDSIDSDEYSPTHFVKSSGHPSTFSNQEDGAFSAIDKTSTPRKRIAVKLRCVGMAIVVIIILALLASATVVFYRMKQLEIKVTQLEQGPIETNPRAASAYAMMPKTPSPRGRPNAHFTLVPETDIKLTPWKERVLQWTPVTANDQTDDSALRYNGKRRSLVVREPGTYFVYNQIYVYRHLLDPNKGLKMKNYTLFHTIYNRPFNYPVNKKPVTITESTLSNCWNENANTQIHTSYQGIIVNLQANDELLVALQDYNAKIDTLNPSATFFGAFKL